jgi:hypothetical protein
MPRVLLIIALLTAQLVSWSASPLFLCYDDGDLSIDLGPGACQCDRHAHQVPDHHAGPIQGERIAAAACDCVHVPLTVAFMAVTVNSKETRPIALSNPPALLTNFEAGGWLPPAEVSPNPLRIAHRREGSARIPVLRC